MTTNGNSQNGNTDHIAEEKRRWLAGAYAKAVEKGGERKDTGRRREDTDQPSGERVHLTDSAMIGPWGILHDR